jgi:dipeptidyl aminopeptidase/acylaminoacyl peptidase
MMRVLPAGILAVWIAQVTVIAGVSASPLQLTDLLSLTRFPLEAGPPVVMSPDGSRVAYIAEIPFSGSNSGIDIMHEGRKQLWVRGLANSTSTPVGTSGTNVSSPVWSPDGKYLAFYMGSGASENVAIWDKSNGNVRVVRIVPIGFGLFAPSIQWMPDSTRILVARAVHPPITQATTSAPDSTPTPAIMVLTSNPAQGSRSTGDFVQRIAPDIKKAVDLVLVDVKTGAIVPVIRNVVPTYYQLSPDGTKLFYTVNTGVVTSDINNREIFDVNVVDFRSGSVTRVAHDILTNLFSFTVTWSPDGSKLAFVGGNLENDAGVPPGNHSAAFAGNCYVIDVHHPGTVRRIGAERFSRGDPLLWSNDSSTIYALTEDYANIEAISVAAGTSTVSIPLKQATFQQAFLKAANHVYAIVKTDEGETQVRDLELRSNHSMMVFHAFQSIAYDSLTFSHDGTRAAYIGQDVSHPPDAWVADANFRHTRQLTHLNPQIERRTLSSQQESVSWRSRSGAPCDGILLLPANYEPGKRYPTILSVYAGEKTGTESRNTFGMLGAPREGSYFNLQLFASRGYAVFVPNSTLRIGHPMRDIAHVILPGADKIVTMGIADPSRLGVLGQSYGGYTTLSLLVQTNRFKAAVATSGISDLITQYGYLHSDGSDWTGWAENEQGRMGGTPWQYRNRYIENSPFFYLDRVQTPVLLEYGDADETVAPYNSRMAFVALRRLGKTATLVGYAGEDHVLAKTSNQIDFSNRMLDWFAKYLMAK